MVGGPYKGGNYPASCEAKPLVASTNEQLAANKRLTEFENKAAEAASRKK